VTTCSCTFADEYWSSELLFGNPGFAWEVDSLHGAANYNRMVFPIYARGVRSGF
jgi:hypothetical protein